MRRRIVLFVLMASSCTAFAQTKKPVKSSPSKAAPSKFASLAIDRSNGFYYGWSFDYETQAEADQKAVDECSAKGGNCSVVLSYKGTGCAAYRTIDGTVGSAFGWGVAKTKEEADAIASAEAVKRSNGASPSNFAWTCNSSNTGALKEIYNASEEIEAPVTVGSQFWSNRNLDVDHFQNGDEIPEAKSPEEWKVFCAQDKPAFVYLNFDPKNGKKFGKLYNFHAVIDPRGLAPKGWHVPSKDEFETLIESLGGKYEASEKLRSTKGWDVNEKTRSFKGNGTNSSGLNLLPGGRAWENNYSPKADLESVFKNIYTTGTWWSSTLDGPSRYDENGGDGYYINAFSFGFGLYTALSSDSPQRGFSVRLIKD